MSYSLVIFGASGDLTRRKLIPALYSLHLKKRLPERMAIIGVSRSGFSSDEWRGRLRETTAQFLPHDFDSSQWDAFAEQIHYCPGDVGRVEDFEVLAEFLKQLENERQANRLYYLSTTPKLYATTVTNLGAAGMASEDGGYRRVIIEKPFGHDFKSAHQLNRAVHDVFGEDQVYRIDHYLGKETVQNLLVMRFANSIFEPIWNRNYVDHVQITVAESVDVGTRGDYYDSSGVLRDMFQNHLLQLMMITAMEAPARYHPALVRDEKVKVLQSMRPMAGADFARNTVRGQYRGYRATDGVPDDSRTATFAAIKLCIDNWRWQGVPFYLRSGKAMSCRTTQIVIQFRRPPHALFEANSASGLAANRLVIQIQPAEGIQVHFQTKVPDAGMTLRTTDLDFSYAEQFAGTMPDAYQRLLLDAIQGDTSLFARNDEVELAWKIIDPILMTWASPAAPPLELYSKGDWGPSGCTEWMRTQGREWFDACPVLHHA